MLRTRNRFWTGPACAAFLCLLAAGAALADVTVSGVFGDNMVLQREAKVPVWGWAEPGEKVTVGFRGQTQSTTTDTQGQWRVELAPMPATAEGAALSISGKNQVVVKNVVIGDVWLCGGTGGVGAGMPGVLDADKEIVAATDSLIRHLKVPDRINFAPQRTFQSKWEVCTPETVKRFMPIGYYFARPLRQKVGVPIGLINAGWAVGYVSSRIESFTTPDGFRAVSNAPAIAPIVKQVNETDPARPEGRAAYEKVFAAVRTWLPQAEADVADGKFPSPTVPQIPMVGANKDGRGFFPNRDGEIDDGPCMKCNGVIMPVAPYALRGVVWYDSQPNAADGLAYVDRTKALVLGWRALWGTELPFYCVQTPVSQLREAHAKIMEAIPRTYMAVTLDISDPKNIQELGWRLSRWALARDYGHTNLVCSGPVYKAQRIDANKIILSFDSVGQGLMAGAKEDPAGELDEFVIAGPDKKWVAAQATINGNTVVVSSAQVSAPVAVRYAFADRLPKGRLLYNRDGLPAGAFRTDTW